MLLRNALYVIFFIATVLGVFVMLTIIVMAFRTGDISLPDDALVLFIVLVPTVAFGLLTWIVKPPKLY
jgi:hypothetical protein